MEQPWPQPQEPTPDADSLPLAGLLAELLAASEADSAPPPEDDPIAALAQPSGWTEAGPGAPLDAAQVLRSLDEAAPPPSSGPEELAGMLLARLAEETESQPAAETAAAVPAEPELQFSEASPAQQDEAEAAALDEPEMFAAGQSATAAEDGIAQDLPGMILARLAEEIDSQPKAETAAAVPAEPELQASEASPARQDEAGAAALDELEMFGAGESAPASEAGIDQDLPGMILARLAEEIDSQPKAETAAAVPAEPEPQASEASPAEQDEAGGYAPAEPEIFAANESGPASEAGIAPDLSGRMPAGLLESELPPMEGRRPVLPQSGSRAADAGPVFPSVDLEALPVPEPALPQVEWEPEPASGEQDHFGWPAGDGVRAGTVAEPLPAPEALAGKDLQAGRTEAARLEGIEGAQPAGEVEAREAQIREVPLPSPEGEDDEFELVDAAQAEKMLDRLLDAARTAIRSTQAPPPPGAPEELDTAAPPPEPEMHAAAPSAPADAPIAGEMEEGQAAEPAAVEPGVTGITGRQAPVSGPGIHEPAPRTSDDRQDVSPIPPAVALMALGLPERLRARLESLGDVERILQSQPAAGAAQEQQWRLLVFQAGGESYALSMESVREVERVGRVTPVPGAPAFVRGLVNLRGEILPLLDVAALVGRKEAMPASRLIVAQASSTDPAVALLVEELNGLAPFHEAGIEPPPQPGPVRGSLEHRGRRVWWLDPVAVFGAEALEKAAGPEERA
jgi:chemotaxis signal transduction protein